MLNNCTFKFNPQNYILKILETVKYINTKKQ